jgi:hypothetical protein
MLDRTAYERLCLQAKKTDLPLPRKSRGHIHNCDRKKFDYNFILPWAATEHPPPTSNTAQNHVSNLYKN